MTAAQLEKLAREAGAGIGTSGRWLATHEELTRFAELVRAAVLEEAAQACEKISDEYGTSEGHRWPELKSDAQSGASACEAALRALAQQAGGEG